MGVKFTRRNLLAAPALVVAFAADPSQALPETAIMTLFKRWHSVRSRFNAGG